MTIGSPAMRTLARLLLCIVVAATLAVRVCAQQAAPVEQIDWPSPDGKFAFVAAYGEDLHTIDLVDKPSAKKLQRIGEEDSSQASWHVLWAKDSRRFALMTRLGHPIQGVDVFFRSGDTFRKIDLPDLPEANIPDKLRRGRKFPHVASQNWQEATAWQKDGSLVVTIDTMIDGGDGGSLTATRTVMLAFDAAGRARIVKSTIRYKAAAD
jgi:hypothetical protein